MGDGSPRLGGWQNTRELFQDLERLAHSDKLKDESGSIEELIDQRYWLLRKTIEHWRTAFVEPVPARDADGGDGEQVSDSPGGSAYPGHFPELIFDLAVVDLFVEKAQYKLTERADELRRDARRYTGGALLILLFAAALLIVRSGGVLLEHAPPITSMDWSAAIVAILQTSAIAGALFGAVYLLIMLARASFHEATILLNRRHSVRLGRLLLYLKLTSASTAHELRQLKREMKSPEFEGLFGWNLQTSTAFKDIRGEAATSTLLGQVLQTVQKGMDAFTRRD